MSRALGVLLTAFAIWAADVTSTARGQTVGGAISGERVDVIDRDALETLPSDGTDQPPPFGSNLFTGGFRAEREDGYNPGYLVQPGDQITIRIWGTTSFEGTTTVDAQGNIFIPEVGPIKVAGVINSELTGVVNQAVSQVFTRNVEVYTNVAGTTPVAVYVTGYVGTPGSYAGVASDSLLYFIDRAGGIDPEAGSYRDIKVLRGGTVMASADLYRFLLDGEIPRIQFEDGDTIVIGLKGNTVSVQGAARNRYAFELPSTGLTGAALLQLARPDAGASHAALKGLRSEGPVSAYMKLSEFAELQLRDGDLVVFEADEREDTMLVRVEGSHLGPSRFAVPRDTTLHQLLDHIEIDPNQADIASISLRRQSIRERQQQALSDTLRRLEAATLAATSQTDAESQIRANEAQLISEFVERAQSVEPSGVLVVAVDGQIRDLQLQPDDIITIPERNDVVIVSGEVSVAQAVVHAPGLTVADYIARAGGYSIRADRDELLILRRSGEVLRNVSADVRPGDEIMVLPEVPVKGLEVARTIVEAIFQVAVTTGIFLGI